MGCENSKYWFLCSTVLSYVFFNLFNRRSTNQTWIKGAQRSGTKSGWRLK